MCSNNHHQCPKITVVGALVTMKTSTAIALAAAALTLGTATVAPISSTAVAGGGGPDKWCGAAVCPPTSQRLGTHRGR
jgi:hypothetical protein